MRHGAAVDEIILMRNSEHYIFGVYMWGWEFGLQVMLCPNLIFTIQQA
jgi:hypothetical protein